MEDGEVVDSLLSIIAERIRQQLWADQLSAEYVRRYFAFNLNTKRMK
jgi:hypothetical protein